MKVLADKQGDIHLVETENQDELFLEGGREVYVHDFGPTCKFDGGPFDEITAFSNEGDKMRKED